MHRGRAVWGLTAGFFAACTLALATPAHAAATPELTTDSAGAPLLTGGQLKPGGTQENCIVLTYKNLQTDTSNGIGMYASVTGTGLADYLDLTVAAGSGGTFGDCTGFVGSLVYSGPLASFGSTHSAPASQLTLGLVGGNDGSVSVRVRLSLRDDNAAQGKAAGALFSWTVGPMTAVPPAASPSAAAPSPAPTGSAAASPSPDPEPAASPSPVPDPIRSGAPTPQDPAEAATPSESIVFIPLVGGVVQTAEAPPAVPLPPAAVPAGPPAQTVTIPLLPPAPRSLLPDDRSTSPAVTAPALAGAVSPKASRPQRAVAGGPASPTNQIRRAISQLVTTAQQAASTAVQAAPTAAKGGVLGLAALPFVLLFLLVQRRLDERDPKLALAPTRETEFLTFEDEFPTIDLVTA